MNLLAEHLGDDPPKGFSICTGRAIEGPKKIHEFTEAPEVSI